MPPIDYNKDPLSDDFFQDILNSAVDQNTQRFQVSTTDTSTAPLDTPGTSDQQLSETLPYIVNVTSEMFSTSSPYRTIQGMIDYFVEETERELNESPYEPETETQSEVQAEIQPEIQPETGFEEPISLLVSTFFPIGNEDLTRDSIVVRESSRDNSGDSSRDNSEDNQETKETKETPKTEEKKVTKVKFVMHVALKKRLTAMLAREDLNEGARTVAEALMNLKKVDSTSINYLGLSKADYSKISYMDEKRTETYLNQTRTRTFIDSGTIAKQVVHRRTTSQVGQVIATKYEHTLKLTRRHIPVPVELSEISSKDIDVVLGGYSYHSTEDYNLRMSIPIYRAKDVENIILVTSRSISGFTIPINPLVHIGYEIPSEGQRLYQFGHLEFENLKVVEESQIWNPDKRYHTSIGKIIRKVFKDRFSDREVTAFAEFYSRLVVVKADNKHFKIVEGEDIKTYYYEDNTLLRGTLGNSCMRYRRCQDYLNIYTKTKDCKLAVLIDTKSNLAVARALVWKDKFLDRVYYANDLDLNIFRKYAEGHGLENIYQTSKTVSVEISNEDFLSFEVYPYIDSLYLYDVKKGVLTTHLESHSNPHYALRRTDGSSDSYHGAASIDGQTRYTCDCCDEEVTELVSALNDRGYSEDVCRDCCVVAHPQYTRNFLVDTEDLIEDYFDNSVYLFEHDAVEIHDINGNIEGFTHRDFDESHVSFVTNERGKVLTIPRGTCILDIDYFLHSNGEYYTFEEPYEEPEEEVEVIEEATTEVTTEVTTQVIEENSTDSITETDTEEPAINAPSVELNTHTDSNNTDDFTTWF